MNFGAIVNALQAHPLMPQRMRIRLLRAWGLSIGDNTVILQENYFGSTRCAIGDGSFISIRCFPDGSESIRIGAHVHVAAGAQLVTGTHAIGLHARRAGDPTHAPVTIGDGCWLGASCMVLPGVDVARGCVIAAGAVVTKSTTPDGLYVGVPARRVRDLPAPLASSAPESVFAARSR